MLVFGCDVGQQPTVQTAARQTVLNVNVIEVTEDENALKTFIVFGKLQAARQSQLGFGRAGRVKTVLKQLGDQLEVGDKLAELDNEQLESQKQNADQTLTKLRNDLQAARGTTTSTLNQQVQQVEKQLKELELEIANGVIAAPYPSVVVQRNIEVGSLVSPGTPAFQVIEDAPPQVEASLPRSAAALVNVGQSIFVKIGSEDRIATLKAKSPLQDPTASQRILLEFNQELPQDSWAFGQVVEIRVLVRTKVSGYWLPLSALQREANGLWSALLAVAVGNSEDQEFRIERRMLEVVQLEGDFALVRGSLADGDRVVVNGTNRIVPGQNVDPLDVSGDYRPPFQSEPAE